jgi:transposase
VDELTREAKFKRRRSRAEIEELVALYEGSGLGGATFCQQKGLSRSTFARYRKRLKQTVRKAAEGKRWLTVEVSSSAAVGSGESVSGLTVVLPGGRRIEVGRGFDADTLKRLLVVVERG